MGLFDFVKNAGKKIFGGADQEEAAKADAEIRRLRELKAQKVGNKLKAEVAGLGLEVEDLFIDVEGTKAIVSGKAASQAEREKIILAIGNVEGISQVEDNLEVSVSEPEAVFYTVQSGDSLSKIAKAQYGDPMKYPVIFEANKPMLSHPDKIYPGQVLRIPQLGS
jgi:nucleoid-associated protein YgaU